MVNKQHLDILMQGVEKWNQWRKDNPEIKPELAEANLVDKYLNGVELGEADLRGANLNGANLECADLSNANLSGSDLGRAVLNEANLSEANLSGANLEWADLINVNLNRGNLSKAYISGADLSGANLRGANLKEANLSNDFDTTELINANLSEADLGWVDLTGANLTEAILKKAYLGWANLTRTNLTKADLTEANLMGAHLVGANLEDTNLTGCRIYGISAWGLEGEPQNQLNLIITPVGEPDITVDDVEVAQFIYLLLYNKKIHRVIDTITSKVVLILGRFIPERKVVLDALREELRKRNYSPVLFDFDKPASRDLTETISTLAHLARFIIADITEPRSIPQELQAVIPDLAVPVQPLLLEGSTGEYAMFKDLKRKYHWVLAVHQYKDLRHLLASLEENVIAPAEVKLTELKSDD